MARSRIAPARVAEYRQQGRKWCARCSTAKPYAEFNRQATALDGRKSECRECSHKLGKAWYATHPRDHRAHNIKQLYGMYQHDYDAMLAAQGERCAACPKTEPGSSAWHIDHDHSTGTVRELLCQACNNRLVAAIEADNIGEVIAYLAHHAGVSVVEYLVLRGVLEGDDSI